MIGYPAQPRLICLSVRPLVISFLIILRKIYSFLRSKLQSRPLGIDTVGYLAQPRLTLAEKIKGPTNLVLIFRNKHDKSGKMHTTNRFGQ